MKITQDATKSRKGKKEKGTAACWEQKKRETKIDTRDQLMKSKVGCGRRPSP
jgi:hypothetical protein